MRNWIGIKELVVGIIIIFLGVSILPSITANAGGFNKLNNTTIKYVCIGKVDYVQKSDDIFSFKAKFVIVLIYEDEQFINNIFVINMGYTIEDFVTIEGIIKDHFIFVVINSFSLEQLRTHFQ